MKFCFEICTLIHLSRQITPKATLTSDNVLFYGYLIALDTSYENTNVFAENIREETLQSDDIQSVTDYRAFIMPFCLSFLFDEAWRTIPQIMF